jgi:hypothetical protein
MDGIDTYRSDHITIHDWIAQNGDDCVAYKGYAAISDDAHDGYMNCFAKELFGCFREQRNVSWWRRDRFQISWSST